MTETHGLGFGICPPRTYVMAIGQLSWTYTK
jgi:hypothetical protein